MAIMKQTKPKKTPDGRVEFVMRTDLSTLLEVDLDGFNNVVDKYFATFDSSRILTDINYEVVGFAKEKSDHFSKGFIFVKVNAATEEL